MIDRMESWLREEPEGEKVFSYVGLYIIFAFIASASILGFFIAIHAPIVNQTATSAEMKSLGPIMMWPVLVLAAAIEELIFRLAPLAVALFFFGRRPIPLLAIALAVSVFFWIYPWQLFEYLYTGNGRVFAKLVVFKVRRFQRTYSQSVWNKQLGPFSF